MCSIVHAALFVRVQRAGFYRAMIDAALAQLPAPTNPGASLLDVGCGPGLLARRAAALGYSSAGIDQDAAMVRAARLLGGRSKATFSRGTAESVATGGERYAVVAASSLLAVVPDRDATCAALWSTVAPSRTLLIIEPSERMTVEAARTLAGSGRVGRDAGLLVTWARARAGRSVGTALFGGLQDVASVRHAPLLEGLVTASLVTQEPNPATGSASPFSGGLHRRSSID